MADRDRNLLFGIFAVQLKKISPSQLMEVAGAWAIDPSRDLGKRLVETGYLSETDEKLLMEFVQGAVDACGGDAGASLAAFGGEEEVNRSFQGSIVLTNEGVETKPMSGVPVEEVDTVPAVKESPGRYSHISEHARGGMGRVLLGRDVALKELLLPSGNAVDPNRATPVRLSMQMMACLWWALPFPHRVAIWTKYSPVVADVITNVLGEVDPQHLHTITFDNGTEFADHLWISKDLSVDIYFARPYCSNDRARNENTNGLLRQYFPKKFKFDTITPVQLQRVVEEINNRPRKTLGYRTPAEVFNQEGVAFRV